MSLNLQALRNDTFEEMPFALFKNGSPLNLTGAVIRMQLRKVAGGTIGLSLTSVANAGITITNASQGLFKINKQIISAEAHDYLYDIEIDFQDGTVKTWISGNFLITNDITR